jgi:hypothetical protein
MTTASITCTAQCGVVRRLETSLMSSGAPFGFSAVS